jgi:hypothetical protein
MGKQDTIQRLFSSFSDLEAAIGSAKTTLTKRAEVPEEVVNRLNSYTAILTKQRNLAESLCKFLQQGNMDEVSRHVGLINGLSQMIRDDARGILASITNDQSASTIQEDAELPVC